MKNCVSPARKTRRMVVRDTRSELVGQFYNLPHIWNYPHKVEARQIENSSIKNLPFASPLRTSRIDAGDGIYGLSSTKKRQDQIAVSDQVEDSHADQQKSPDGIDQPGAHGKLACDPALGGTRNQRQKQ